MLDSSLERLTALSKGCNLMPYEVKWYRPDDIMLFNYSGNLPLEDVISANKQAMKLASGATDGFFVLVNLTEVEAMQFTFHEMVNDPIVKASTSSPLVKWVIYFGGEDKPLSKFLVAILAQSSHHNLMFKKTLEEALEFIEEMRTE